MSVDHRIVHAGNNFKQTEADDDDDDLENHINIILIRLAMIGK
jgi:hypothetical protein